MPGMTQQDIYRQVQVIKKTTARLLAEGPEACEKFLIDAGIIKKTNTIYNEQ